MSGVSAAVPAPRSRALLVTPVSPWDTTFGGGQRSALLLEALAELMPVDVLMVTEGERNAADPGDRPELIARLTWRHPRFAPYKYGIHSWVDRWCRENIDFTRYGLVAGRYLSSITKATWPSHARTMVDCDDVYYRYIPVRDTVAARATAGAKGWARWLQTKAAIGKYDHVFFCSERDRALFRHRSSSLLPNAVQPLPSLPPAALGPGGTALIVGAMWYPPNRQGVEWFLERCWPAIAARCPALTLRIVGAAAPELRAAWSRAQRTEAPGFVEDLAAEYSRALFAIAPLHYGGGTCIKFLEAAAFGKACVITRHVHLGFAGDFHDRHSVMVAENEGRLVAACIALYEDAAIRDALARQAHAVVARSYTVDCFRKTVRRGVERLLGAPDRI